jgi:uncharacterized OB-fold protein
MPKPSPTPTPETLPYWEGARDGVLRIPQCHACDDAFFPPSPVCPACGSADVGWRTASGRASLTSYVINQRPAFGFDEPYVVAIVELEEGPRLLSNIVGVPPEHDALELDTPLVVSFEERGEWSVPVFRKTEVNR